MHDNSKNGQKSIYLNLYRILRPPYNRMVYVWSWAVSALQ